MTGVTIPDLSQRSHQLHVERQMAASPTALFKAWTEQFDLWFARPGTVLMEPHVNAPFFFETEYRIEDKAKAERHPHYGRLLRLEPGSLVEMTWVTGAGGTEGAETVVTVELTPKDGGTLLTLTHAGFASEPAMKQHEAAWPMVLEQQDKRLAKTEDDMDRKGTLEGNDTVRFERTLPGPLTRVWEHLTSSEHMPAWFGSEGMEFRIEPRVGGRMHLMGGMFTGVVKEWQPPKRLVLGWSLTGVPAPETTVTYDLATEGDVVRLKLSQGPIFGPFQAASFSGWHTFLDRLEALLRGEDPGDVMQAMRKHREAYLKDYPEGTYG